MCQTSLYRQNPSDIDCQVGLKPQKQPLYTQVVRISIKTCDMTTAALSISKKVVAWLWKRKPKGKLGVPFLLIPCKGGAGVGGVLVVSSWKSHPRYWKKCLGITYFCYDLRRTKEVVKSIHISLVVSVQCGEGARGWRGWTGWDHGIEVLRQRGGPWGSGLQQ